MSCPARTADGIRAAIRVRDGAAAQRLIRDLHSKQLLLAHMDAHGFWFADEDAE